jgi:lipopolysaccharide/colanic/teichoic acid biosynthesis glycosyltransferase
MSMKRVFDVVFSILVLLLLGWLLLLCYIIASMETQSDGIFRQRRVGQYGKLFVIYKIKTMHPKSDQVTFFGKYFRKYKLDELPQFYNVLIGNMSVVGPRPDIEGYYDKLQGEDRKVLELKPGITSEASLKYFNEDQLLEQQENPIAYNDTVIFPDKIKMNLEYYYTHTFLGDLKIILKTIF